MMRSILLCLALGLGGGAGLAFLLERIDDRVSSVETLERTSGLATLGVIPHIKGENLVGDALADPRSPISEAYRSLCTSLQFATDSGLPKTLFLTSAGPAEGKSFTSLAVARHFATLGLKVLIIDADLRNPSLHRKLGVDQRRGPEQLPDWRLHGGGHLPEGHATIWCSWRRDPCLPMRRTC